MSMLKSVGCFLPSPRNSSGRCRRIADLRRNWRLMSATAQAYKTSPPQAQSSSTSLHDRSRKRQDPATNPEEHLNTLFAPLRFPSELAERMLTHASHPDAKIRHNQRLSFMGRRVMQFYLLALLDSAPSLRQDHDYETISKNALNTYILGEHVAPAWSLSKALKWSPPTYAPTTNEAISRSVGMYKVFGGAVEAVVGGVNHQFGGVVTQKLFHTRVLPHILLPNINQGLNDAFHDYATEICERFGGPQGNLLGSTGMGAQ